MTLFKTIHLSSCGISNNRNHVCSLSSQRARFHLELIANQPLCQHTISCLLPIYPTVTCLSPRIPITGVCRYGRIINKAVLDLIDRKHFARCAATLFQAHAELAKVQTLVRGDSTAAATAGTGNTEATGITPTIPTSTTPLSQQMIQAAASIQSSSGTRAQGTRKAVVVCLIKPSQEACNLAIGCANLFMEVCKQSLNPPKQRVYEAVLSRIQKSIQLAEDEHAESAVGRTSSGTVCEPRMTRDVERAHSGSDTMQAAPTAIVSHADSVSEAEELHTAAVRLVVARETASTMKPDLSQLATAQVNIH